MCAALVVGCGGGGSSAGGGGGGGGTGGGNSSTTVTITFVGPGLPVAVAAQIGTGAFAAQTLSHGTLTLSIPTGTSNYAVADLCPAQTTAQPPEQSEFVWEASIADGTSFNFTCGSAPSVTPNLTASLDATAIPGVQIFFIYSQNGESTSVGGAFGPTMNFDVPASVGSDRVLVLAYANQSQSPLAAKNFDNQTVPGALNGDNTVVFGTADQTTLEPITYNNVPSGYSSPSTAVALEMGGAGIQEAPVGLAGQATTQYAVLPASATEKGDAYSLDASASGLGIGNSSGVGAGITTSGGPVSFTFPAPWSETSPTPAALPSFTMDYTGFPAGSNVSQIVSLGWTSGAGTGSAVSYYVNVQATASYQGKATTLAVPNLSSVAGVLAAPASGAQVEWSTSIMQQSYGVGTPPPLNGTWSAAYNGGLYTVP